LAFTVGLGKISRAGDTGSNLKFMREQIQNILSEIDAITGKESNFWDSYNNVTRSDLAENPYASVNSPAAGLPAIPGANQNGNESFFNQYAQNALNSGSANGNGSENNKNQNKNDNYNLPEIPPESYAPSFTPDPNMGGQQGDQKGKEEDELKKMMMQLLAQIIQGILGKGQEKTGGGAGGGDQPTKAQ